MTSRNCCTITSYRRDRRLLRLPHAGKYTNGQIGGGPPITGQRERSMHVLPAASKSSGLMSQLSIAVTLKSAKQMERTRKRMALMLMLMSYLCFTDVFACL